MSNRLAESVRKRTTILLFLIPLGSLFLVILIRNRHVWIQTKDSVVHYLRLERPEFDAVPRFSNGNHRHRSKACAPDLSQPLQLPSPFYVHYVRFVPTDGNRTLRFTDYLSVLSAVQYLKPDGIILHGDFTPEGVYWKKLIQRNLIRHVHRTKSTAVGHRMGKPKVVGFLEHAADMSKLDVLLEYGGVAVDFDVFFVRGQRIKDALQRHKSITCYGDKDGYNIGFVAAHKDSKLLYAWRRSYQDIYVPDWNFQQAFVSKFLSVIYRDEVYVMDKVCNNPNTERLMDFFANKGIVDWTNSAAIHTYERFGRVPVDSPEALLNAKSTSHTDLLRTIYANLKLPPADPYFNDKIDPLLN